MTHEQKIESLKALLGKEEDEEGNEIDIDSAILDVYLEIAGQKILNKMYPFKTDYTGIEVPDRYSMMQLNISQYLYNKRGSEGEIQHIENGIHRNYGSADVPDAMLKDIIPMAVAVR